MHVFVQGIDRCCSRCKNPCMAHENESKTEEDVRALMAQFGSDLRAAKAIGVSRQTFWRWRQRYGLEYGRVPLKAA